MANGRRRHDAVSADHGTEDDAAAAADVPETAATADETTEERQEGNPARRRFERSPGGRLRHQSAAARPYPDLPPQEQASRHDSGRDVNFGREARLRQNLRGRQ